MHLQIARHKNGYLLIRPSGLGLLPSLCLINKFIYVMSLFTEHKFYCCMSYLLVDCIVMYIQIKAMYRPTFLQKMLKIW